MSQEATILDVPAFLRVEVVKHGKRVSRVIAASAILTIAPRSEDTALCDLTLVEGIGLTVVASLDALANVLHALPVRS